MKIHPILHSYSHTFKLNVEEVVITVHGVTHLGIKGHLLERITDKFLILLMNFQTQHIGDKKIQT